MLQQGVVAQVGGLLQRPAPASRSRRGLQTGNTISPNRRSARRAGTRVDRLVADREVDAVALEVDERRCRPRCARRRRDARRRSRSGAGSARAPAKPGVVVTTTVLRARCAERARRAVEPPAPRRRGWKARPSSVSARARCRRRNSGTPSRSSSAWICRLTADCVSAISSPARVKLRWRAAPRTRRAARAAAGRRRGGSSLDSHALHRMRCIRIPFAMRAAGETSLRGRCRDP